MDSNMVQVSNMMSNLKNMGLEMGQEIERQNQVIERVTKKVFDHGQWIICRIQIFFFTFN